MNLTTRILFFTFVFIFIITVFLLSLLKSTKKQKPPNILFIVADDLGWNDVSWHNFDMITPNLHQLATQGIILNQSYVHPMCTPSRAAFLTGQYPFRYGLQHFVFRPVEPMGLPLHLKTLGQYLQELGYKTHLIGKWHLGYCSWDYTPTFKGFNSFFGYYTGGKTHFTHQRTVNVTGIVNTGYNLFENETVQWQYNGTYSTFVYTQKAIEVIKKAQNDPFFLFYSLQSPHEPLEVPKMYFDMYPNIKNNARRIYSGMVTAIDESIAKIVETLKTTSQYDNTLIVFTSDNGGENIYGGNNWPLRGNKATLWEGGTRVVSFVHAPFLKKTGYVSNKLIHIVDWFATFLKLAGGKSDLEIDGVDQWSMLNEDGSSARREIIYNIDNTTEYCAAIRIDDHKLIIGDADGPNGWITPDQVIDAKSRRKEILSTWKKENDTKVERIQLYNLKIDPYETTNIASQHPDIVENLKNRLKDLNKHLVPNIHLPPDPKGLPCNWREIFSPGWCQAQ